MRRLLGSYLRRPVSPRLLWAGLGVAAVVSGAVVMHALFTDPIDSYTECTKAGYPVMESNPPVCRAGGRNFVGPALALGAEVELGTSQPFDLLTEADHTGAYPRGQQVIRTQAGWQDYWHAVHAGQPVMPPLLPVDFRTNQVLVINTGLVPTDGYDLRIVGILTSARGTTVDFTETVPTISCKVANRATNRYLMVRTVTLPEPVTFRLSPARRECNG